jgi:SPP1 family predicted phage head-tail adaptor
METGSLNERIKIYIPAEESNLTSLSEYKYSKTVWANVRPITTREQLRSGINVQSGQMTILIRYRSNLSDDCLIKWHNSFYSIDNLSLDKHKGEIIIGCSYSSLNENQRLST